jgi:type IV secretion system protein VirB9
MKKILLLCLTVFVLQACVANQQAVVDDGHEPVIEYLNMDEFEQAEATTEETQFVEVPTVKLQEGQLKPLPKDTRIEEIKTNLMAPAPEVKEASKAKMEVVSKPIPIPIPSKKDKSLLTDSDRDLIAKFAKKTVLQSSVIAGAKERSQINPSPLPENWINAITVYDYMEGALYQIYLTPNRTTDIFFSPGEEIISQAAGDTLRWVVGETESGNGKSKRFHLLVKPRHTNIETNLTIMTNMRTYYLELHSTKNESYMAAVQWNYPNDNIVKRYKKTREEESKESSKVLELQNLTSMNFEYKFKADRDEDDIEWYPVRAFDDGKKTFIQFPPDMRHRQAPALYVLSNERNRKPQIVNYRVKDGYYIVDRIFQAAVLMEGTKTQRKVTILNEKLYKDYHSQDVFASNESSK